VDYKDKLGEAQKLFEQAKAIVEKADATADERAKVEQMLKDAQALKAEALQLKSILDAGVEIAGAQAAAQQKGAAEQKGSGKFETWGDFLQAVFMAGHPNVKAAPDPRLRFFKDKDEEAQSNANRMSKKDMAEAVGATGGFLVPVEQQNVLQGVMGEGSLIRPLATRIPMARRQISLPVLDQTGTTTGVPHWFGGMRFYWAEEASQKTESDANFRQISLVAHKLIGYTRASDELVDDSAISLDAFLSGPLGFAGGVSWMEDFAFFQGTGAGQPLGVINAGATISVARQVQAGVTYTDLVNMFESLLPSSNAAWFISQSAISNLMTMTDPGNNYLWPTMYAGGAAAGRPPTLLGMPVFFTEKLPRVGTAGDVLLADWHYYLLGDRQATTIESTKFDRWQYDQTSWRVVHRVDGQPWLSTPLTYQDGVTQTSPFVILGSKST
jgi:HK97 family phage major capsid protein